MMKPFLLALLSACAFAWTTDEPSLDVVLSRVERYIVAYEPQLSRYVATEDYAQGMSLWRLPNSQPRRRKLRSDFLFMRLPGDASWLGIRQVLSVDGHDVPHSQDRLRELVSSSPENAGRRAAALARESARYNLGEYVRTVNVPTCVLGWLHPQMRQRFTFTRKGSERIDGVDAWRVAFEERSSPTVIRTDDGGNVRTRGTVWVDPQTGAVLQTNLQAEPLGVAVEITVQFQVNDRLGFRVPAAMQDRYFVGRDMLSGSARYSDFRVFGVTARIRNN